MLWGKLRAKKNEDLLGLQISYSGEINSKVID